MTLELRQRLDKALAREAATAEVLQVINSSPGDLVPVFDAIERCALRPGNVHSADGWRLVLERTMAWQRPHGGD